MPSQTGEQELKTNKQKPHTHTRTKQTKKQKTPPNQTPEADSKFTQKVTSVFKHLAELTSANRALARAVSYFMYEL